jgi:hypothetical protein
MSGQPVNETGSPALHLRVRMFRQGLGDCFLLSFYKGELERHVLIDCGVLQGTSDGEEKMRKVARNIRRASGKHLDLVVATHEHWDHLSGFVQAQDIFDQVAMDQIWMAWTEDPSDPFAQTLREEHSLALQAVRAAVALIPEEDEDRRRSLFSLLNFFGEPLGASSISGAREALNYLAKREDALISYCRPGEALRTLPGLPEVRFFVLGPPRDEALLKKTRTTKTGQEGYGLVNETDLVISFLAAVEHLRGNQPGKFSDRTDLPFDERYCIPPEEASQIPFFRRYYGFGEGEDQGESWRRIERDWLAAAGQLALDLDSATNNTSLVLAIELVDSGRVLLFPADAQVGNWLSWEAVEWTLPSADGSPHIVKGHDLLSRTVLYKVGHHGSHNATLREKGLELMVRADLHALIPVDREKVEQMDWNMPFPDLFERLIIKTRGRVIRQDDGIPGEPPVTEEGLPLLNPSEWQEFLQDTDLKELYIDFRLA